MNWYDSLIKKIENNGNNIFLYDLEGLLADRNFYKDLSHKYDIFKYETDGDYFRFKSLDCSKPKLMYSNEYIKRAFTKDAFKISVVDVFDKLDESILDNMDVRYYQKLFDYCKESEANNLSISRDNTQNIIFQCIWGIDLAMLYNPTINLRIGLEYLIDKKNLDDFIIKKISSNLGVDFKQLFDDDNKTNDFIESIILNYIDENQFAHKFDLSDPLIQYYLSKYDLKSQELSDKIDDGLLNKYPWLIKFKLVSDSKDLTIKKINSEIIEFQMYYDKIYEDGVLDLNDLEDVFKLSKKYFTIIYEIQSNDLSLDDFDYLMFNKKINDIFKSIVSENIYEQLFNYPYNKKPFTVDRILDYINYNYKNDNIALIVMDGMSYDEWFILKRYLNSFKIKELESFSILPSITSYSRTSIFTGKTPNRFLDENNKVKYNEESKGFTKYFTDKKIQENDILWGRIDLNNNVVKLTKGVTQFEYLKGYKVLGLVCNLFDDESHSINVFGENKSNLYKNIISAIESSKLVELLDHLRNNDYKVILTSDHGNVYCEGNGISHNKMLESERKSIRCLMFDSENLADNLVNEHPDDCFKFKYNLLSNDIYLVFAINGCFGNKTAITHGSFTPEECIVPVVILE